jgi:hypothetical protein
MRRVFGWHTQIPGCAYYRIQLPLRVLAGCCDRTGWNVEYDQQLPLPRKLADDLKAGIATAPREITAYMADRFDVVIGQQVGAGGTGADVLWQHMARSGKIMMVLETDDNLMALHDGHLADAREEMRQRGEVYRRAVEVADVVTCTTPGLVEAMAPWNSNVRVIPNYIDAAMLDLPGGGQHVSTGGWGSAVPSKDRWPGPENVLIGWGGSSTHQRDFALAWPGIARTLVTEPRAYFASMGVMHLGDQFEKLESRGKIAGLRWMDMKREPWPDYYRRIGWYDIGLAPLELNDFNRSKSWIKILEYCAMGVPFVASAAPEYERFLASWRDQQADAPVSYAAPGVLIGERQAHHWAGFLRDLVQDDAERQRMSARARIFARQFTIQDHIGEWASALAG